jgi:predicted nucleotidyltransferase
MSDTRTGKVESQAASGRFLLRIDPGLHTRLRAAAQGTGLSLNDYCARRLAVPMTDAGGPGAAVAARAASQFGEALVGVIVYGSWARDELAGESDVDVLLVVDDTVTITRDLYRTWDENALSWYSRELDVHFAHPPMSVEEAGGMWLEVAMDGAVLYDRDLRLSRTLGALRSLIASGRIARHHIHGQSYWVKAD